MYRHLRHLLLYSVVGLLITVAILLSGLRLLIGHVGEYRQYAEELASSYLGQAVTITGIDARILGHTPSLVLEGVTLLDDDGDDLAGFRQLALSLDSAASLWQLQPVLRVTLIGATITISRQADGHLTVQGLPANDNATATSRAHDASDTLLTWLQRIPQLEIRASQLNWQDKLNAELWQLKVHHLHLYNQPGHYHFKGQLDLPDKLGKQINVAMDLYGNPLDPASWDASFYVKLQHLQATARKGHYRYLNWQLEQAQLDLELWGEWREQRLELLEGDIHIADLLLSSPEQASLQLERLSAQLSYQHNEGEHHLQLQKLHLHHGQHTGQPMHLDLKTNGTQHSLLADQLILEHILPLVRLLPWLDETQQQQLQTMAPAGQVDKLYLSMDGNRIQTASARLQQASMQAWQKLPGISGLTGRLDFDEVGARLVLDSQALQIELPQLFRQPLALHHTRGELLFTREEDGWRLFAQQLRINTPDIQLQAEAQLLFDDQPSPLISLQGQFQQGKAIAVQNYLPTKIMPGSAVRWLDQAFLDGSIEAGQLTFQGRAGDFPFRQAQGQFEVLFEGKGVTLRYAPDWPTLHEVDGEIHFINAGMKIHGREARIYHSQIHDARIAIKDFHHALLEIEGMASADAQDGLRFLRESPLARELNVIHGYQGKGKTQLQLQLAIPLDSDIPASALQTSGEVEFLGSEVQLYPGLGFTQIHGTLYFDHHRFRAHAIQARLHGEQVSLDVLHRAAENQTVIIAQGQLSPRQVNYPPARQWLQHLDGSLSWLGQLYLHHHGNTSTQLFISSSGQGLISTLPTPLAKEAETTLPLSLSLELGGGEDSSDSMRIGDRLAARWHKPDHGTRLQRIALNLGSPEIPSLPVARGIQINGQVAELKLHAWQPLLGTLDNSADGKGTNSTAVPVPISIKLSHLHLLREDASEQTRIETSTPVETDQFPLRPIQIEVGDLRYEDMVLGSLSVQLTPSANQLLISDLQLHGEGFQLNGEGNWQPGENTRLELDLESSNLGGMLTQLGYASIIRNGEAHMQGTLQWPGSPGNFALQGLSGKLRARIDDGTIEEVRPGAGKLLGVLSLQALPRRLMLDFRDIAERGLHFNHIYGDITLIDGQVFNRPLHIDTHPAQIQLNGRTGLVTRDFDQEMSVIPKMRDTISIAGALAMGPQIGALLVVLQNLFKKDIDDATKQRYHIGGSWEKPEITSLNQPPEVSEEILPW